MQLTLFPENETGALITLEELFEAYENCRRNKRNTMNAAAFEVDYEKNLVGLLHEINSGTWSPGRSIAFIVERPVKREIFAADFRDRVVHHLLINKLNHLFEKEFIYDSYACRAGKGTQFGIQRVDRFIRRCSKNYTDDCFILKLDLMGFFMHIHKRLLFDRLAAFLHEKYTASDRNVILRLCSVNIFNKPAENCLIKGSGKECNGLPHRKSLLHSPPDCGLPIGNLTSQVFGNFYMNRFDHFIKSTLKIKSYGRYVDDFVIVHESRAYLKSIIPVIKEFLKRELRLDLHPDKIYLQHYSKGVKFLGAVILPGRKYIANRTKGNFYGSIEKHSRVVRNRKPDLKDRQAFLCSMNSYLGIMKHYRTYNIRKKYIQYFLSGWWLNYYYLSGGYEKFVLRIKGKLKRNVINL